MNTSNLDQCTCANSPDFIHTRNYERGNFHGEGLAANATNRMHGSAHSIRRGRECESPLAPLLEGSSSRVSTRPMAASGVLSRNRPLRLDPVADLPGDLAALIFSFVDVIPIFNAVQHVSHHWRDAVNGGLPALWHDIRAYYVNLSGSQVKEIAHKSRGHVQSFTTQVHRDAVPHFRSFCDLRVLDIGINGDIDMYINGDADSNGGCSVSPILPSLPLLEELVVSHSAGVDMPPSKVLKTVRCHHCQSLNGLHNLPALTELVLLGTSLDPDDAWPASLLEVEILDHSAFNPRIVGRIAQLQQLIRLDTDWSFVWQSQPQRAFFKPPFDQLSFLSHLASLQRFSIKLYPSSTELPSPVISNILGAVSSLRELTLEYVDATDQDLQIIAARLTHLQYILLYYIPQITTRGLRHVCRLPNLNKLLIFGSDGVTDYSCVGMCSQLRELQIGDSPRRLSLAAVQAIAQLQRLQKLVVGIPLADSSLLSHFSCMTSLTSIAVCARLEDPHAFSHLCKIRNLTDLHVFCVLDPSPPIPITSFSALPNLSSLESLYMQRVESLSKLVDCLVQMPKLRSVRMFSGDKMSAEDKARLRDALPRLGTLEVQ